MSPTVESPDAENERKDREEADKAFAAAIKSGRLSEDPLRSFDAHLKSSKGDFKRADFKLADYTYAGDFMYMGSREGRALFKHYATRDYLP